MQLPGLARLVACLCLLIFLPAATRVAAAADPELAPLPPSLESTLRSIDGATATGVTFVNLTSEDRHVFWLDYNGLRVSYEVLSPGESFGIGTFLTHPWVITNAAGTGLAIYLPEVGNHQVTLAEPELTSLSASLEGLIVSTGGDLTTIRFVNDSGATREVYWLDFTGQRVLYHTLTAGQEVEQVTYLGHPWLIAAPGGAGLAIYWPEAGAHRITIRGVPPTPYVDLNGDVRGDAFIYHAPSGTWAAQLAGTTSGFTGPGGAFSPGWSITSGRFNTDEFADLFLVNPTSGQWFVVAGNGVGGFTALANGFWSAVWQRHVLDLNGDGISDVFLWDPATGAWFKSLFTGAAFSYTPGFWSPGWEIHPGSFDHAAPQDFFLFHRATGQWFVALGTNSWGFAYPFTGFWSADWQFRVGDFSGDSRSDVLLNRPATGQWFVAASSPAGFVYSSGFFSPGWTLHVVDLDANSRADLLMHNQNTGQWFELLSTGVGTFGVGGTGFWSVGWTLYTTDFNADRRTDVLLYNPATGVWFQARNLSLGTFSYSSGIWGTNLGVVTGGRIP